MIVTEQSLARAFTRQNKAKLDARAKRQALTEAEQELQEATNELATQFSKTYAQALQQDVYERAILREQDVPDGDAVVRVASRFAEPVKRHYGIPGIHTQKRKVKRG